jgi:hypothetical protein
MKKIINPVGVKYGKLLVLEQIRVPFNGKEKYRKTTLKLKCQCDCGNIFYPFKGNVLSGTTTGCPRCQNCKDLSGGKFGKLHVLRRDLSRKKTSYVCLCDCGTEEVYSYIFLTKGKKIACDRCLHPKKYLPRKTKEEVIKNLIIGNFNKHENSKNSKIGKKIGLLKVIRFSHWKEEKTRRRPYYFCKCRCGNVCCIRGDWDVKSCGCLHKKNILRGESCPISKLTNKQASAIRELYRSGAGYTGRQLANMFGISEHIVSHILNDKSYKNED